MNKINDKYAILHAREDLKKEGIGVSSDRAIRQRTQLREAREASRWEPLNQDIAGGKESREGSSWGGRGGGYLTRSAARVTEETRPR